MPLTTIVTNTIYSPFTTTTHNISPYIAAISTNSNSLLFTQGMSTKDYMYEKNYEGEHEGVVAYPNNHIDNNAQQIAAIVQVRTRVDMCVIV